MSIVPSREAIARWLVERLVAELGAGLAIERDRPLADYGLDSVMATGIAGDAEEWLDMDLDPLLFFDHPTVDAISEQLAALARAR